VLETIYSPVFLATDLVNLGFAQVYLTLMINGVGSPPFSATTLPPFDPPPQKFVEQTLANSRRIYGRVRTEVENSIKEWQESDPNVPEPPKKKTYTSSASRPAASSTTSSAPRPAPPPPAAPAYVAPPPRAFAPEVDMPPGVTPPPPSQARHEEAKALGASMARKHAMASSKANSSPVSPSRTPHVPKPAPIVPDRPPLEGAKSLRDALAQATGKKIEPPPVHARDLKETLHTVAPKAEAKPVGLPEDVIRSMLAVDPSSELGAGETGGQDSD